MENKKPLANIIEIEKKGLKSIIMPENQADDPAFGLNLGDEVTLTITGRVEAAASVLNEDLFNFKRVIKVVPTGGFLASVKTAAEVAEEKEEEEEKAAGTKKLFPKSKVEV